MRDFASPPREAGVRTISVSEGERRPPDAPRIVTARSIGLTFANKFGELGPELHVTGHYSAGRRARTGEEAIARARSFHEHHRRLGWGGLAYHYLIADDGTLICGRPTLLKGAHVGGHNSNNIGVNTPGTVGDRPTRAQGATYEWLLANAHTDELPREHRTDRDLRRARRWGHRMWPGHASNGCPGLFLAMYLGRGRHRERGTRELALHEAAEDDLARVETREQPADGYPPETVHGTTVADTRHVSVEEAEKALENGEVDEH